MFNSRRRYHALVDELERFIAEMERDLERTLRTAIDSDILSARPLVRGFSMQLGPDGQPIFRSFGDFGVPREGYRQPVYDQLLDQQKGELKIVAELPGVEKEDLRLNATENELALEASRGDRRYKTDIRLRAPVQPSSAAAQYHNGVLEVRFRLKEKANKDFTKISVT
jgi:HSP20 family protein